MTAFSCNNTPFFSIITSARNRGPFITQLIDNVSSQTFESYEHIICDNASTDNSLEILSKLLKSNLYHRLKVVTCDRIGIAPARNTALSIAQGRYIIILDSDNMFHNQDALHDLHNFLVNNPCKALFSLSTANSSPPLNQSISDSFVRLSSYYSFIQLPGECANVIETSWLRDHPYPEIPGCITEFPTILHCSFFWPSLACVFYTPIPLQFYNTTNSHHRVSSRPVTQKCRDMVFNYWLIISKYPLLLLGYPRLFLSVLLKLFAYSFIYLYVRISPLRI